MTRVLVVEDDPQVGDFIEKSLQRQGYDVPARAATGDQALALAREHLPDLVLMDIGLKGPVDGIAAAEQVRDQLGMPVVFLTAYTDEVYIRRARATDAYGYLIKPFHPQELRTVIEFALYKHAITRRLVERERFVSTALRSIADAVIALDMDGRVTLMNAVAEALAGVAEADALGRPVREVYRALDPDTRAPAPVPGPARLADLPEPALRLLVSASGVEIPVEESVSPMVDDAGRAWGAVLVFRDVTERRALERRLGISERLASLGTLAAGFAHEINNPLAYVVTNLDYLQKALDGVEAAVGAGTAFAEIHAALHEAQEGAARVGRIVADVKGLSRPQGENRVWLDVHQVLEAAVKITRHLWPSRATIVRELEPVAPVQANEARLGQLFVQLLLNAAQAIPGPGEAPRIRVATRPAADGRILVEVEDNGPGIAPEVLGRVFDPFFTTRPVGSGPGLGLSICHRIVTDLGGTISLDSAPGRGTRVRVELPASAPPDPGAPA
ncbi:MAG: response regulator [Deltaproteobacteria bacterium]|nr:response regulator [Deltaproteobacteria bacterium]